MIKKTAENTIETRDSQAPEGCRNVELVFRTIDERTSKKSFELALKHIKPNRVHIVRNIKPFSLAVQKMLQIDHRCSHVVYVDADCLILEDMRPFLNINDLPFVDCFVQDRFRGRVNCGVHIVRLNVIQEMLKIPEPKDDLGYILRPESYLRNMALLSLGLNKQFKTFNILHDYLQKYTDIFSKYALRELRSHSERMRERLSISRESWDTVTDYIVAKQAIVHAKSAITDREDIVKIKSYISNLPSIAREEIQKLKISQNESITEKEFADAVKEVGHDQRFSNLRKKKPKVFGLGLSRTGTHSLSTALNVLGFDTIHNPIDKTTLETLKRGDGKFPLLDFFDGMTDITAVPFYKILDRLYPNSRFILTVRDEKSWLQSCRRHWNKPRQDDVAKMNDDEKILFETRNFLRMAVYGTYEMSDELFVRAYHSHVEEVKCYFEGRNSDLLIIDITKGEGFEKLASFLGMPVPKQRFPHKNRSKKREKVRNKLLRRDTI